MTAKDLTAGMVVTAGEKCHDETTAAVMIVFDDDGVLSLRCKTCGDVYAVKDYSHSNPVFARVP